MQIIVVGERILLDKMRGVVLKLEEQLKESCNSNPLSEQVVGHTFPAVQIICMLVGGTTYD